MKKLLLSALLLVGLASCSKNNSDPAPTTASLIMGDWVADDIFYIQSATSTSPANSGRTYDKARWNAGSNIAGPLLTIYPDFLIEEYSRTGVSGTGYSLTGNTFSFPKQTGTDSLTSISSTSFTWSHRVRTYNGGTCRYVMHFHR